MEALENDEDEDV
jgi:hypothetical protein